MEFRQGRLDGVVVIELEAHVDERGYFLRTFDVDLFERHGLVTSFPQSSVAGNEHLHTLRGLHYQAEPHTETKVVTCLQGAVFDVLVDLRPESPTFRSWESVTLSAAEPRLLYVPQGVAHGYLTLTEQSLLAYRMSARYLAEAARGVRWDDPALAITWPAPPKVISSRDQEWPLL